MIDTNPEIPKTTQNEVLVFFDPFADNIETSAMTAEDCELLFETIETMYTEDKVKFSDAAEKFLKRAKAIETDATYLGYLEQASWIEARMHFMCGEDHSLNQARLNSGLFDDHVHVEGDKHDDEEKDNKKKSRLRRTRERVNKTAESLWSIIFDSMISNKSIKGSK